MVLGIALGIGAGCTRDVRLAGKKLRSITVGVKTHFGMTLDKQATPDQVAYVLLRAIREDVSAKTPADREKALDVQFDLAAVGAIEATNRTHMDRNEYLYNVVYRWAPTVSHYAQDLPLEWDAAKSRLVASSPTPVKDSRDGSQECEVRLGLSDPSGDPNARVVLIVWLVQDSGFWRVTHLGFDSARRTLVEGQSNKGEP